MSHINVSNIIADSNPTSFLAPFQFSITFECLQPIKDEIEWKVIYVGSPKDSTYDQELDSFTVGPFSEPGIMQFNIEPPAPNWTKIPTEDILGVAAIIHSVSYQKQEFFRVGYFVYNTYDDPYLVENPYPVQPDKLFKSVLADKPRIIRHNIDWESQSSEKVKALNDIFMENANVLNNDNTIQFKGFFSDLNMQNDQNLMDQKGFSGFGGFNWNNNSAPLANNNQNFDMGKENYNDNMGGKLFSDNNKPFNSGCFMNQENGGNFNNMNQPSFFNQQNGNSGFMLSEQNGRGQQFGSGFFNCDTEEIMHKNKKLHYISL